MTRLNFRLEAASSTCAARAATFTTLHNTVRTPLFMPVGTQATVRSQTVESLETAGAQVLLANAYHLLRRPGLEVFRHFGGIHRFMNWKRSVLTDSGGFQIFSLRGAMDILEEGARFRPHPDEPPTLLSPERSIDTQRAIGSDIMMVLDHCVPSTADHATAKDAADRTFRWAVRSLEARGDSPQALFAIVQGACYPDLRRESAGRLTELPMDGFAIGGLAVGESRAQREDFTALSAELLPPDRPRYLMGVGTPLDLLEAVRRGVDMFDCILPTALAQQGLAYTSRGTVKLRRATYRLSEDPLDPDCGCPTCRHHCRAYLHHLIKVEESLGWQLVATHNLFFYHRLMADMRAAILEDRFDALYSARRPRLAQDDEDHPIRPPKVGRRHQAPLSIGDYEVYLPETGPARVRHRPSGELMHSVEDPQREARRLYIEQSGLEALLQPGELSPLVVWDVGLGAATNAMAVVHACETAAQATPHPLRPLQLVSFERDLDALRLALRHPGHFAHLNHAAPHTVIRAHHWQAKSCPLSWTLLEGDFLERLADAPAPDLIFFDPFSYKTDAPLWTLECFQRIFAACHHRPALLFTYTVSTAVRAALLSAGFYVARGVGTGPKLETTVALTPRAFATRDTSALLGPEWLERWERSARRWPAGLDADAIAWLEQAVRTHPQLRAR